LNLGKRLEGSEREFTSIVDHRKSKSLVVVLLATEEKSLINANI